MDKIAQYFDMAGLGRIKSLAQEIPDLVPVSVVGADLISDLLYPLVDKHCAPVDKLPEGGRRQPDSTALLAEI